MEKVDFGGTPSFSSEAGGGGRGDREHHKSAQDRPNIAPRSAQEAPRGPQEGQKPESIPKRPKAPEKACLDNLETTHNVQHPNI